MKYLLLNSLKAGGAERVAQTLASSGLFDKIIILEKDCDYEVNIPIHILSRHTYKTNSVFKTLFIPFYAIKLSRLVKKEDVVVSFVERANFVNIVGGFLSRHKTVLSLQINFNLAFKSGLKRFYLLLIKFFYPQAKAIVPVSGGIKINLNKFISYKGINKLIYNASNIEKTIQDYEEVVDTKWDFLNNNLTLINTGRLSMQKGQWNLLRIFKKFLEKGNDAKLLIMGAGELEGALYKTALDLGLKISVNVDKPDESANIFFMGYQSNPYKFYKSANLFIMTSSTEGLPLAMIEAMACGLPVISSDCEFGPRELLSPKTSLSENIIYPFFSDYGLLLPVPKDESFDDMWVNNIIALLDNKERLDTYKVSGKKRAQDFSLREIIEEWKDLFEEIG